MWLEITTALVGKAGRKRISFYSVSTTEPFLSLLLVLSEMDFKLNIEVKIL